MSTVTLNSFLEDTSVLVASAFLLVRGRVEQLLTGSRWVGLIVGVFGATEAVFPGDRYPYAPHTLACAFASIVWGATAGIDAALLCTAVSLALLPAQMALLIGLQAFSTVTIIGIANVVRKGQIPGLTAATMAQAVSIMFAKGFPHPISESLSSVLTVPANSFGLGLLLLVLKDAKLRTQAEKNRHKVTELNRIATQAQLAVLRSRVQPHFLFNALNAIAALCIESPKKASAATVQLGSLMRHALEVDFGSSVSLETEMATVQSYLYIEQERFGPKLRVDVDISNCGHVQIPAFSVQILVENAVRHGISQLTRGGLVSICAHEKRGMCTISVADDGAGIDLKSISRSTPHGLKILFEQLRALYGKSGRLHVMPRQGGGTLAVFQVPASERIDD